MYEWKLQILAIIINIYRYVAEKFEDHINMIFNCMEKFDSINIDIISIQKGVCILETQHHSSDGDVNSGMV